MSALEVVIDVQQLLNVCNEVLKFTGGDLKLSKCYWTLQDYMWQHRTRSCYSSTVRTICISSKILSMVIDHVLSEKMRTLVGVPITPSNDSVAIVLFYLDEIKDWIEGSKGTNLNPQDVLFEHESHWLPALKFAAPVLTISHNGSLLAPLRKSLLQKLKVMCKFPLVMRSDPAAIGGFDCAL